MPEFHSGSLVKFVLCQQIIDFVEPPMVQIVAGGVLKIAESLTTIDVEVAIRCESGWACFLVRYCYSKGLQSADRLR